MRISFESDCIPGNENMHRAKILFNFHTIQDKTTHSSSFWVDSSTFVHLKLYTVYEKTVVLCREHALIPHRTLFYFIFFSVLLRNLPKSFFSYSNRNSYLNWLHKYVKRCHVIHSHIAEYHEQTTTVLQKGHGKKMIIIIIKKICSSSSSNNNSIERRVIGYEKQATDINHRQL